MMLLPLFFFVFLTLNRSVHGQTIQFLPECWHSSTGRYDPLACWLLHLQVNIPDQSFHSGLVSIDINSLQCSNFTIGALLSSYQSPSTLEWNAQNVSAICQGSYQVTGGLITGQVHALVNSYDHAMDIALQILSSSSSSNTTDAIDTVLRPRAVQTTKCQTNIVLEELQFTGSISAKIVNLFSSQISHYVTEALQQQVCPLFPTQVDPWLTAELVKVNEWIDRLLMPSKGFRQQFQTHREGPNIKKRELYDDTSELIESSFVNLQSDIPFFKNTMEWLNAIIVQPHLHQGLLPHHWLPAGHSNDNDSEKDVSSCGFFFDGWNGVIQSLVTKNRPEGLPIQLPMQNISILVPQYAQLELQLHNLSIVTGLEQWEQVDLFRIQSPREISALLENRNLTVRCDMKMVVQTIPGGMFQGDDLVEYFSIQLHADSMRLLVNLQLDFETQILQTLTMETILELLQGIMVGNETMTSRSLDDLLHGADRLEASELIVDMVLSSLVLVPHVESSIGQHTTLEDDLDDALNNLFELVLQEYQPLVREFIKAGVNGSAKDALNAFFNKTISDRSGNSTRSTTHLAQADQSETDAFNLTKYLLYLNDYLGQQSTTHDLNQYLDCIGTFLGQVVEQHWANSSQTVTPKLLQLVSFAIESLGSFQEIQFLTPDGEDRLTTATKYGSAETGSKPRFTAVAKLFFAPLNVTSAIDLVASIDDVIVELISSLSYDISDLRRFSLSHVLQYGQCLLTPLAMSFDNANGSLGVFQTVIRAALDNPSWNQTVTISLDSDDYPELQGNASFILDWAVKSMRDILAGASRSLLTSASYSCEGVFPPPNHSDNDDDTINYSSICLVIVAILIFAQPVLFLLKTSPLSREEIPSALQTRSDLEEPLLNDPSIIFDRIENTLAASETPLKSCLMHSTKIPSFFRIFVPILIFSTTLLLLSSNLNVGATVDLVLRSGDDVIRLPPLFGFSLVNTAKEMLQARIYPLFFLVVAFSGVWPYCKLFLMLMSWVAETSFLSMRRRERLLLALDALSKFSLVDTYVLVLFVVAFRYHLDLSPDQNGSSALDVYVTPQFGFYGFLLATALSLIAGHMLVYYHRRVRLAHKPISDSDSETLIDHRYAVEDRKLKLSRNFCVFIGTILAVTLALLGLGITRECFHFDFGGLGGIILGEKRRTSYSLLSLGSSLSDSVENPGSSGILFLQFAYYFYAVFTPFATLLLLAAFTVVPLSARGQLTLITLAEIANAWSAVEVFVLSIVAAVLQISTFSSFIIGNRCDLIEKILLDQSESPIKSCFSVHASVSWEGAILLLAVLLNSAWVSIVLRLAHLALEERFEHVADSGPSALAEGERIGQTFVERLASNPWTRWAVDFETEYEAVTLEDNEEEEDVVVPDAAATGDESRVVLPEGIFEEAWKEPADHDPTWKEWKAESPGQSPDR